MCVYAYVVIIVKVEVMDLGRKRDMGGELAEGKKRDGNYVNKGTMYEIITKI